MAENASRDRFVDGLRDSVPMYFGMIPFSVAFGAAAVQAGYTPLEILFASATIFAGASQFVFIEVNGFGVPGWSVILSVLAVNFRHLLYSASIGRWMQHFGGRKFLAFFFMTDLQWAMCEARVHGEPRLPLTVAWYFGYALPLYALWVGGTFAGLLFGSLIEDPEKIGLDFLITIYFTCILMGFRRRTNFAAVFLASGAVAYLVYRLAGPPWHITLGALAGIVLATLLPAKRQEKAGRND